MRGVLVELKAKAPAETVLLVRVDPDVPWQSVIGLLEAASYENSATPTQDGELFPDSVFEL